MKMTDIRMEWTDTGAVILIQSNRVPLLILPCQCMRPRLAHPKANMACILGRLTNPRRGTSVPEIC